MNKKVVMFLLVILVSASTIQSVNATTVFLTSDNVGSENETLNMLNSVKNYIEEISNGEIQATVDSQAPSPGEGTRAIESTSDVSVNFAAVDAANLELLADYASSNNKQIIFVNMGDLDLDNTSYIRRAWDDNYSSSTFAGLYTPGQFLNDAGISYIQPVKQYPDDASDGILDQSDDNVNRYIAQTIVDDINSNTSSKTYDSNLIEQHSLSPSVMAEASSELYNSHDSSMNGTYNSYSAPQVLYMSASYLNGTGLSQPGNFEKPANPLEYSRFTKSSYTYYDYMRMGTIVKEYMDENGRAPDSIEYDGATIGYYDLVYNYAKITKDHTDTSHMDFQRSYNFDKVHDSLLYTLAPFIGIGIIIVIAYFIIRWLYRRRYYNRRRRY